MAILVASAFRRFLFPPKKARTKTVAPALVDRIIFGQVHYTRDVMFAFDYHPQAAE